MLRRATVSRRDFLGTVGVGAASLAAPSLVGCTVDPPSPSPARPERLVVQLVPGMPTREGAGVRLARTLGSSALPLLDPFLLLDEIRSDQPADYAPGFPRHPHRGFETVTYMIEGAMEHRDSLGNEGRLGPGAAQWMTAGHGIVHSEMPKQERGLLWGLQLWVNLPRARKMTPPRYQDIVPDRIPEVDVRGSRVRVVAGALAGERGPVEGILVAPTMLDVKLGPGGVFEHELPRAQAAFAYVLDGVVTIGPAASRVPRGTLAVLGEGSTALVRSEQGGRILLLAADRLGEPIARRGPFVMSTQEELDQAFEDYGAGRLTGG